MRRFQRIPHPMYRYQVDGPTAFGNNTWACHVGCGDQTHWRVAAADAHLVPPDDAPEAWGLRDECCSVCASSGSKGRPASSPGGPVAPAARPGAGGGGPIERFLNSYTLRGARDCPLLAAWRLVEHRHESATSACSIMRTYSAGMPSIYGLRRYVRSEPHGMIECRPRPRRLGAGCGAAASARRPKRGVGAGPVRSPCGSPALGRRVGCADRAGRSIDYAVRKKCCNSHLYDYLDLCVRMIHMLTGQEDVRVLKSVTAGRALCLSRTTPCVTPPAMVASTRRRMARRPICAGAPGWSRACSQAPTAGRLLASPTAASGCGAQGRVTDKVACIVGISSANRNWGWATS